MMTMADVAVLSFIAGAGCGVVYTFLIVKHIAKKRGVWEILNKKETG